VYRQDCSMHSFKKTTRQVCIFYFSSIKYQFYIHSQNKYQLGGGSSSRPPIAVMGIYFLTRAIKFWGSKGEGCQMCQIKLKLIYKSTSICDCQRHSEKTSEQFRIVKINSVHTCALCVVTIVKIQSAVYWMLSKRGEQLLILVRGWHIKWSWVSRFAIYS